MTEEEYKAFTSIKKSSVLQNSDLKNKKDRTLLYGYDVDVNTVHLYLKDGKFNYFSYDCYNKPLVLKSDLTELNFNEFNFVPNKRCYPEACDYEFCKLLNDMDIYISMTTFGYKRGGKLDPVIYHGKIA